MIAEYENIRTSNESYFEKLLVRMRKWIGVNFRDDWLEDDWDIRIGSDIYFTIEFHPRHFAVEICLEEFYSSREIDLSEITFGEYDKLPKDSKIRTDIDTKAGVSFVSDCKFWFESKNAQFGKIMDYLKRDKNVHYIYFTAIDDPFRRIGYISRKYDQTTRKMFQLEEKINKKYPDYLSDRGIKRLAKMIYG